MAPSAWMARHQQRSILLLFALAALGGASLTLDSRWGEDIGDSAYLRAAWAHQAVLLLSAALAIRGGWRQFRQEGDAAGLMLCFLVGGYLLRCLLDGHFSGWRLGLFAFLCGVLIAAMKKPPQQT